MVLANIPELCKAHHVTEFELGEKATSSAAAAAAGISRIMIRVSI